MKYYALFYDVVDDYVSRRATFRAEHLRLAQEAHQLREAVLSLVVAGGSTNPEKGLLALKARALLDLNRAAEARPIVERLTSLGYRHPTLMKAVASSPNFTHRPPATK